MIGKTLIKSVLVVIMMATINAPSMAIDFTFISENSTQPGIAGQENYLTAVLTNTDVTEYNFVFDLDTASIGDWEYFWCIGECYAPFVLNDTIPIAAGADTLVEVHITPNEPPPDQGGVTVTAYPESEPQNSVTIQFLVYFGTGVEKNASLNSPGEFTLSPAFPNPFNPGTSFSYTSGQTEDITISVYNPLGQKVRTLFEGLQVPGTHTFDWDGKNDQGFDLPGALYIITVDNGEAVHTIKSLKLK